MGYQDEYKPRWLRALDDFADGVQIILWNPIFGGRHRDWHSWIHHGMVAALVTFPFGLVGWEVWAAGFMFVFYFLRELLTVWRAQGWKTTLDNWMDLVGPLLVLGVALL